VSSETLHDFDPRRTIQLLGFSGRAATTTLHDATETGFQIFGIFHAAEDFTNVQIFSAYDCFNHLRVKPLPLTDLSGLTLQYDMEILPANSEEGNVRPDCVRYASAGWDKLTITTGAGDTYEVPLVNDAAVVTGGYASSSFGFLEPGGAKEERVLAVSVDPENQSFQAIVLTDHAAGERIRPAIRPTPVLDEGDDLAFDIMAAASPDPGSDLTVVIQT
jgi:hypothetical protein